MRQQETGWTERQTNRQEEKQEKTDFGISECWCVFQSPHTHIRHCKDQDLQVKNKSVPHKLMLTGCLGDI